MKFETLYNFLNEYHPTLWEWYGLNSAIRWVKERQEAAMSDEMTGHDITEFIFVFLPKALTHTEFNGLTLAIKTLIDHHYPGLCNVCRFLYRHRQIDLLTETRANRLESDVSFRVDLANILDDCAHAHILLLNEELSSLIEMTNLQRHEIFLAIRNAKTRGKLNRKIVLEIIQMHAVRLTPLLFGQFDDFAKSHLNDLCRIEVIVYLLPYLYSNNFLFVAPLSEIQAYKRALDQRYPQLAITFPFFYHNYPTFYQKIFTKHFFESATYQIQLVILTNAFRETEYRPDESELELVLSLNPHRRWRYVKELKQMKTTPLDVIASYLLPEKYNAALKMVEGWTIIDASSPEQLIQFFELYYSLNYLKDESAHEIVERVRISIEKQYPGLSEIMSYPEADRHVVDSLLVQHERRTRLGEVLLILRQADLLVSPQDRTMLINMPTAQLTLVRNLLNHQSTKRIDMFDWTELLKKTCTVSGLKKIDVKEPWSLESVMKTIDWYTSPRYLLERPSIESAEMKRIVHLEKEYSDFIRLKMLSRFSRILPKTEQELFVWADKNREAAKKLADIGEILIQLQQPISKKLFYLLTLMSATEQEMFALRLQGLANKSNLSGIQFTYHAIARLANQIRRAGSGADETSMLCIYLNSHEEIIEDNNELIRYFVSDPVRLSAVQELIPYLYEFGVRLTNKEMNRLATMPPIDIKMLCIHARQLADDMQLTHAAMSAQLNSMHQTLAIEPAALTRILPYCRLVLGAENDLVVPSDSAWLTQMDVICSALRIIRIKITREEMSAIRSMSSEQREHFAVHLKLAVENGALDSNQPLLFAHESIHAAIDFFKKPLASVSISKVEKLSKKETGKIRSQLIINDTVEYYVQTQPEMGFLSGSEGVIKKIYDKEYDARPVMVCKKFHRYLPPTDEHVQLQASASTLVYKEPSYVFHYNDSQRVMMHYVDGFSYEGFNEEEIRNIPLVNRLHMIKQLFREILALHQQNLSHGDIIPANIQISYPAFGREHRADAFSMHLIDFGRVAPTPIPGAVAVSDAFKRPLLIGASQEDDLESMGKILRKTFPEIFIPEIIQELRSKNPQHAVLLYAINALVNALEQHPGSIQCHCAQIVDYLDGLVGHLQVGLTREVVNGLFDRHIKSTTKELRHLYLFTSSMSDKAAHTTSEPPLLTSKAKKNNPKS